VYGVCHESDFYGGDIPYTAHPVDNLTSCMEACANTEDCIAAGFTLGICYLKEIRSDASFNNNVDSIYRILTADAASPATTMTTDTGVCFGGSIPKSILTVSNGDVYGICSGNDFYGGDLQDGAPMPDLEACNEACSKKSNCVAVSFTSGSCWLKETRNSASLNTNVDAAYKISSGSQSTTTSASTAMVKILTLETITTFTDSL
jgi:hypothetical protein